MSCQARDLRQSLDGVQGFIHLALAHFVGDHNDLGAASLALAELHDRLDRHVAFAEAATHLAITPGHLLFETHIVALANVA